MKNSKMNFSENVNDVENAKMEKAEMQPANAPVAPISGVSDGEASKEEQDVKKSSSMFDYNLLFSRGEVEDEVLPSVILPGKVDELVKLFKSQLESVSLSFHQRNKGTLFVQVKAWNKKVDYRPIWCAADNELCFAVMCAMRGKHDLLEAYKAEEHSPMVSEDNIVLDIFQDFLKSRLRVTINRDYVTEDGVVLKNFSFHLSKMSFVKFCIEATPELEEMINSACFGK